MENKKRILIVVDAQHDFVDGSLANEEAQKVIPKLAEQIRFNAPKVYDKIYFTRDTHKDNYLDTAEGKKLPIEHCIEGTTGWCVVEELTRAVRLNYKFSGHELSVHYVNKSTFGYPEWDSTLGIFCDDDVALITLVGFCTDICVISNALILKAMYPNANIKVLAGFCAGTTPEKHRAALEVMKSCHIEVIEFK